LKTKNLLIDKKDLMESSKINQRAILERIKFKISSSAGSEYSASKLGLSNIRVSEVVR